MKYTKGEVVSIIGPTEFKDIINTKKLIISISKSHVMHKKENKDYVCKRIGIRISTPKRAFAFYTEKLIAIYQSTEYSLAK